MGAGGEGWADMWTVYMCSVPTVAKLRAGLCSLSGVSSVSWSSNGMLTPRFPWLGGLHGDFKCPPFWILCTHKLIPWMAAL